MLQNLKNRASLLVQNRSAQAVAVATLAGILTILDAHAGTGGKTSFGTLEKKIVGWLQGDLGVIISVVALAVGLTIGIVRQSMIAVVVGIGIAIALYYGPTVIEGVLVAAGGLGMVHPLLLS